MGSMGRHQSPRDLNRSGPGLALAVLQTLSSPSTCSTMSTSNLSTTQYQQLQLKLNAKIKENELLKQQLARLTEDVEELRQDKKYLRGHNEDLKGDMVRLREELAKERREKEEYKALAAQSQVRTSLRAPKLRP